MWCPQNLHSLVRPPYTMTNSNLNPISPVYGRHDTIHFWEMPRILFNYRVRGQIGDSQRTDPRGSCTRPSETNQQRKHLKITANRYRLDVQLAHFALNLQLDNAESLQLKSVSRPTCDSDRFWTSLWRHLNAFRQSVVDLMLLYCSAPRILASVT